MVGKFRRSLRALEKAKKCIFPVKIALFLKITFLKVIFYQKFR